MSLVRTGGGAALGVVVPIGIEYAAKGKRFGATEQEPGAGYKYSGVVGVGLGAGALGLGYMDEKRGTLGGLAEKDRGALYAFGGASLATGGSILVLDELRKRELYEFKQKQAAAARGRMAQNGGRFPLTPGLEEYQRTIEPVTPMVEEI